MAGHNCISAGIFFLFNASGVRVAVARGLLPCASYFYLLSVCWISVFTDVKLYLGRSSQTYLRKVELLSYSLEFS